MSAASTLDELLAALRAEQQRRLDERALADQRRRIKRARSS